MFKRNPLPFSSAAIGLALLLATWACDRKEASPPAPAVQGASGTVTAQTVGSPAPGGSKASSSNDFKLIDANEARVAFKRAIYLGPSGSIEGMDAPIIELTRTNADFVRLMRCAKSYQMRTTTGEAIDASAGTSRRTSDMEWAWTQALNDSRSCKLVGEKTAALRFPDLASESGEYYYVANPCINKERAKNAREGCSYNLAVSSSFTYKDAFKAELREKAAELSAAEGALNAHLQEAVILARKIELHLRACEDLWAHDSQVLAFKTGLVRVGFMIVGAAVGAVVGGFIMGPANGAVMGSMLAQQVGAMLIVPKVLNWPVQITNECVNPDVIATTAAEREAAKLPDGTYKGKYEDEFRVQALAKQLAELLEPETGKLAKASQRVAAVLTEMQALDSRTITVDETLAQLANAGVDTSNADALGSIVPSSQNP